MKKTTTSRLLIAIAIFLPALALSSCGDYIGPNNYVDPRLSGAWELVAANGAPVGGYASNYFDFYSSGSGFYYEYRGGQLFAERISFWCSDGYNNPQLFIQYSDASELQAAYWFDANGNLYMRWMTGSGPVTYTYAPIAAVPY